MKKKYSLLSLNLLFIFLVSQAQVNLQNQGTLYIGSSSDTLYINGAFTNTSAATFTNNGKLYVKQNLSNSQASMAVGTGSLYLSGSSAQSVNGTQTFKTYNLITNNSSGITLNNNLSVSGVHTFTAGLIATSVTPNYLVYETGSSYTGDADNRHINGWVKKYGSTSFTFPVGDATYERTVAVSSLSAVSEINCHYYIPTQNIYNLWSPLVQVKANEYWQLDKVSGGTAQIVLNWNNSKVAMDNVVMADIQAAQYISGSWTSAGGTASGNVTTTGTITSNAISSFGPVTIGYRSFPVPLKMISFTAERRIGISFLNWITENEENVDHFDVQRSYNATIYTSIGIMAARNSGLREVYNFEDHSALNGIAYYRLQSIDRDGMFSYSKIAVVSENDIQSTNFYVMNPARSAITIFNKTGHSGQFDYRLYNAGGQLLLKGDVSMSNNGGTILQLPSQTTTGVYILELSNEKLKFRQKLILEK